MISPEEILLDASNLPSYNPNALEGRLITPISPRALRPLLLLITLTGLIIIGRTSQLMLIDGEHYQDLSERNRLGHTRIFAERGIIYDRNGIELAWNVPHYENGVYEVFHERAYASTTGSGHILGYVRMPARDRSGVLFREGIEGVSGVELSYDSILKGTDGIKIVETDARMDTVSTSILEEPTPGKPLHLTIDLRLQEALHGFIKSLADDIPFYGGAGIMMDVTTGEILAMTSYPEYDPSALIEGNAELINQYNTDPRTPYLNRTFAGQYTPGSIVKPFLGAAALDAGIITPETTFISTGALRLANPYNPGQYTVFNDWRAHGAVNLKTGIAFSSDVYFYYIGGGFGTQEGLGITRIKDYMSRFGFGSTTDIKLEGERSGTIPSPEWKAEMFPDDPTWRIGNTYHTAIGQYGFQVTPLQAVRALAALANGGTLITPRVDTTYTPYEATEVGIPDEYLRYARAGMREAVINEIGTARGLNVSYVDLAGKTGTAELGVKKDFVNSWVMGFYPYENPKYAFVILMEHGPVKNLYGGTYVMRQFLDWMRDNTPEYVLFDDENE